mgnify:CR=1 FL=1
MNKFFPYEKILLDFFKARYNPSNMPTINYLDDVENSDKPLGKTAFYSPTDQSISVYTTGRHIKDILRSLAHELIHHLQNERGELKNSVSTDVGYAQENDHMREMEREAYEKGNLCLRDWEDGIKKSDKALYETIYNDNAFGGSKPMSTKKWKDLELNTLLMEKWGYTPKKKETLNEEVGAFLDTSKGGDYKTGQKELPEEALKEEEEEMLEAHPHDPENRLEEDKEGHKYSGGGYLPYSEEEEIEEGTHKGEKTEDDELAYEDPSKGEEITTGKHKGEKAYGTHKGTKIKTGKTKGEEAYEGPSKGEKSKTHKGEEDYTTKKGMKKKTGPGKAFMQEELMEQKLRKMIRSVLKQIVTK